MNVSTFFSTFVYFFVGSTDSLKIVSYLIFISGIISIPNIKILYFKRYFNTFCLGFEIIYKGVQKYATFIFEVCILFTKAYKSMQYLYSKYTISCFYPKV